MRTVIAFFVGIVTAGVVAGLGVLIIQDTESEQLTFLGASFSVDKGVVVAGAVALGFLLAVLMLLPGLLASAWNLAYINRQTHALEERLRLLREEHAQLHGWHQRLVQEHGLVLNRVLPSPASLPLPLPPPAPPSRTAPPETVRAPAGAPAAAAAQPTGASSR